VKLLRQIAGDCKNGTCPTAYLTDHDTAIVQGKIITDPEALAALGLPEGETAVEVPVKLIRDAATNA
jgi:hypothetical protein